ncbi:Uncharacterised protein [uncultured archaeon]|nr:Uncharacterised protein [uncultured archaeon]
MADVEIIEKIASIDEQNHDLRKMVLESGTYAKNEEAKAAARAWLTEAKKLEKKWPKTAPSVLEMTGKDRRIMNETNLH